MVSKLENIANNNVEHAKAEKDTSGKTLAHLLMAHMEKRPEDIAVIYKKENINYRELVKLSSIVSANLLSLGITVDKCVGIYVDPSIDLMVGIWGILFSGAAYLPLSPEYPDDRIRYMIDDARIELIFTSESLKHKLLELVPSNVRVVTFVDALCYIKSHDLAESVYINPELNENKLAYVVYTSGSTGKPKGVMIEHHSIVSQMHWMHTTYGLDSGTVILHKTPMSFDAAQWEILALCYGATVVVGSNGIYRDPEAIINCIIENNVNMLQCVPTLLQAILDLDDVQNCISLVKVFSGGETLSKTLALQFFSRFPYGILVNLYGPTEYTINSSSFLLTKHNVENQPAAISIGKPVSDTSYYILDENLNMVSTGEIAELYISGEQLARGYLHKPDLTSEKFMENLFSADGRYSKMYRTGDLSFQDKEGNVYFVGRVDSQVKLRGFRIELDEVRLAIEEHPWVKHAAVLVNNDQRTGAQHMVACVELNPREAALMDQGNHSEHHQSKESRLQVRAQISNPGRRDPFQLVGRKVMALPGKTPDNKQIEMVFARKTYRHYEGGPISVDDITRFLSRRIVKGGDNKLNDLNLEGFGQLVRYLGQFHSDERLLPKYGYASPGALYATQIYFELRGFSFLPAGYYYYDPANHELVEINRTEPGDQHILNIHFVGKREAIEPIYKNNILEVLELEVGHILGYLDIVLPMYQMGVGEGHYIPAVKTKLDCSEEDFYLGSFNIGTDCKADDLVDIYVQAHENKVLGLCEGLYKFVDGALNKVSDDIILKKHVVAINQQPYQCSSFGISVISRESDEWMKYVSLGRKLHHIQMNDDRIGVMPSGYSSKTGNNMPSAVRMKDILSRTTEEFGAFYFCTGGKISEEQIKSQGMLEDVIHMKGPAEMIRDDIRNMLPDYMIPNKIVVMNKLPLTVNGKINYQVLKTDPKINVNKIDKEIIEPRNATELLITNLWKKCMKTEMVSVNDDFFECGGNSLIAVWLINNLNKVTGCKLPLQIIFEAPSIEKLAKLTDQSDVKPVSRLAHLNNHGSGTPIFCWPGLGGYPMNLRLLGHKLNMDRPFYGVQAHGINVDEQPYESITKMAEEDIRLIRQVQPKGPYNLWGYSFGALVAFETAYQLEQAGEVVENLVLIAPGSPKIRQQDGMVYGNEPVYENRSFVTILFSVFSQSIHGPALEECLKQTKDEDNFISCVCSRYNGIDCNLVKKIVNIVKMTYKFKYSFHELLDRRLKCPITVLKAAGDDHSFIDGVADSYSHSLTTYDLQTDHYSLLKEEGILELIEILNSMFMNINKRK